jgi:hypothetical protein
MAQKVILKRSNVQGKIPTTTDLDLGELAINTYDGKLFIKKDDGTEAIVEIAGGGSDPIENDYDATSGQTDFVISGKVLSYVCVFVNGVKIRSSDYAISDDGTDTTVTFNNGLNSNDWVQLLEY